MRQGLSPIQQDSYPPLALAIKIWYNMDNTNENGYAIICLWCEKNKTMDDRSNTCEECLKKSYNYNSGPVLIIYDKI